MSLSSPMPTRSTMTGEIDLRGKPKQTVVAQWRIDDLDRALRLLATAQHYWLETIKERDELEAILRRHGLRLDDEWHTGAPS